MDDVMGQLVGQLFDGIMEDRVWNPIVATVITGSAGLALRTALNNPGELHAIVAAIHRLPAEIMGMSKPASVSSVDWEQWKEAEKTKQMLKKMEAVSVVEVKNKLGGLVTAGAVAVSDAAKAGVKRGKVAADAARGTVTSKLGELGEGGGGLLTTIRRNGACKEVESAIEREGQPNGGRTKEERGGGVES